MQGPLAVILCACAALAAGCSWSPVRSPDPAEDGATWNRWGRPGELPAADLRESPAARGAAVQVVDLATQMIGTPYRWGGATPAGFDCSGLVFYTFGQAGLSVPRTSQEQFHASRRVSLAEAEPGDLVFFGRRGSISHVGIYIGSRRFIHAPDRGRHVKVSSIGEDYYRNRFAGVGRLH